MVRSIEYIDKIDLYLTTGEYDIALEYISNQLEKFNSGMDYCRLKIYESHILSIMGNSFSSIEVAKSARDEARNIDHVLFEVKALIEVIYARWNLGQLEKAYELVIEAETLIDKHDLPENEAVITTLSDIYETKGIIADNLGMIKEGIANFEKSLSIRRKIGSKEDIAITLNNLAIVLQSQGKMDKAKDYLIEALAIKQSIGNPLDIANTISNLAILRRRQGKYDQALGLLNDSLSIYIEYGNLSDISNALLNKILFQRAAGYIEAIKDVFAEFKKYRELFANQITPVIELNYLISQAIVFWELENDTEKAIVLFQQIRSDNVIDHTLSILVLQFLIELRIKKLETTKSIDLIELIEEDIDLLADQARIHQLWPKHVVTLLLKSQLKSRLGELDDARNLLYSALRIAERHSFEELIDMIDNEIEYIDKSIEDPTNNQKPSFDQYIGLIRQMSGRG